MRRIIIEGKDYDNMVWVLNRVRNFVDRYRDEPEVEVLYQQFETFILWIQKHTEEVSS